MRVLQQAIFHGRSKGIEAQIYANGIPLNLHLYNDLKENYEAVRELEIEELNKVFDVYELGKFSHKKFEKELIRIGLL